MDSWVYVSSVTWDISGIKLLNCDILILELESKM